MRNEFLKIKNELFRDSSIDKSKMKLVSGGTNNATSSATASINPPDADVDVDVSF